MLSRAEKERIAARVRELEARTGVEIVTAFAERCDHYPEIPWKAFALGTATSAAVLGLAVTLGTFALPSMLALALVPGGGLALMLLSILVTPIARLFLDRTRAEAESRQYAEGLFLAQEIFATPSRRALLLLVARFEHQVVILPDRGLREHLTAQALEGVIRAMTTRLVRGEFAAAFDEGLATLEPLLGSRPAGSATDANHLPDTPIEGREP